MEFDLSPSWFEMPPLDVVRMAIPPARDAAACPTLPKEPDIDPIPDDFIFELPLWRPPKTPPPMPTMGYLPSIGGPF